MNFAKEIAGLPGLMKTSAEQLRKVPALTGTAMLTALNVIVGTLFIPITPTLRIGFSSIPAAVCGMYYGPICTGFAGAVKIHRYQDRCFRRLTLYIGSSRHNEILISFPDRERGT